MEPAKKSLAAILAETRKQRHLTQSEVASQTGVDFNTISRWETGKTIPRGQNLRRICEVLRIEGLLEDELLPIMSSGTIGEFLPQCAAAIAASGTLSDNGKREDILLASQVINVFLPMLRTIINESSQHRSTAAILSSTVLQMKQRLAYHLEDIEHALNYADHAVTYARTSKDDTTLVMALRELAGVYEWPMEHIRAPERRKKALELTQEAAYILHPEDTKVPKLVQSWAYIGLAKFQAFTGLEQEAYRSIGDAQATFADSSPQEERPGFHLDEANLIRQESITYAYLNKHEKALHSFLRLIDLDEQLAPRIRMPARTHLGTLSEATFSSLKLPQIKKDKEISKKLWKVEWQLAKELQSQTYLNEARLAWQIMEALWPDDAEIRDFRDLIER